MCGSVCWARQLESWICKTFNDWKLDLVGNPLCVLQKECVNTDTDKVMWKGAYMLFQPTSRISFPKKRICISYVPQKTAFFAWESTWGKVLTLDKLQRRAWKLPNRCYLCGCAEKTIHPLLLHCPVVSSLWEITLKLVGAHWVFPRTVKDVISSWRESFVGKKRRKIWYAVPLCIF